MAQLGRLIILTSFARARHWPGDIKAVERFRRRFFQRGGPVSVSALVGFGSENLANLGNFGDGASGVDNSVQAIIEMAGGRLKFDPVSFFRFRIDA
jgi:hypothetical protein